MTHDEEMLEWQHRSLFKAMVSDLDRKVVEGLKDKPLHYNDELLTIIWEITCSTKAKFEVDLNKLTQEYKIYMECIIDGKNDT
jgi:hypothetical protein